MHPPATPSSQAALEGNWAHWGASTTAFEPSSNDANCAVAGTTSVGSPFSAYWYYTGTSTAADRKNTALYIKSSTQNVWMWQKVGA